MADCPDETPLIERVGFDAETNVLTHRQAEILCLREQDFAQAEIADRLGTSRANVASIEASARENIEKSRETIAFVEAIEAPVQVTIEPGSDLYDVPRTIYSACDEAGLKVDHAAPELMNRIRDSADDAIREREVHRGLLVGITSDGQVRVRYS